MSVSPAGGLGHRDWAMQVTVSLQGFLIPESDFTGFLIQLNQIERSRLLRKLKGIVVF